MYNPFKGNNPLDLVGNLYSQFTGASRGYKIDEMNYNLQRDIFQYQKRVQKKLWQREDNAMQRRSEDLEKAGFSRVLAVGQGGAQSGPAVSVTAPQKNPTPGPNLIGAIMDIANMKATIANTLAQNKLIKQQIETSKATGEKLKTDKEEKDWNILKAKEMNMSTNNNSIVGRNIKDLIGLGKAGVELFTPHGDKGLGKIQNKFDYHKKMFYKTKGKKKEWHQRKMLELLDKMTEANK